MFFGVEDVAGHDTSWRAINIIRSPKGTDDEKASIMACYLAVSAQNCSLPQ
jgi:hypothetical protein